MAGFLLSACSSALSEGQIATALVQAAAERTQTAQVDPTPTVTLELSATLTGTTLPAAALTATVQAVLSGSHMDGVYQVGVTIAAGVWRSIPQQQDRFCYWARRKYDGILLGSHYGPSGGEILVRPTDYEVEFDGCGVWVYMGER